LSQSTRFTSDRQTDGQIEFSSLDRVCIHQRGKYDGAQINRQIRTLHLLIILQTIQQYAEAHKQMRLTYMRPGSLKAAKAAFL